MPLAPRAPVGIHSIYLHSCGVFERKNHGNEQLAILGMGEVEARHSDERVGNLAIAHQHQGRVVDPRTVGLLPVGGCRKPR